MGKYKITNKTGMRVSYAKIKFEPKETKVLELESNRVYEHEYFSVEKIETKTNNQKSLKSKKRTNTKEVKQNGISRRVE